VRDTVNQGLVPRPQVLIITGDIANSGGALRSDEYDLAQEWLARLTGDLGLKGADVLTVAGNHDINVGLAKTDHNLYRLIDSLRRGAPIDEALGSGEEKTLLASQLEGYRRLVATQGGPCLGHDGLGLFWVAQRGVEGGFTIRIAGLTTSLLSRGLNGAENDDRGKLQLGLTQIRGAFLPAADPSTVTIVLTHHPFVWMRDGAESDAWTSEYADVHLLGHVHEQASEGSHVGGRPDLVVVTAGAAHGDEGGPRNHSYNFGAIMIDDDGAVAVRVRHHRWARTQFIPDLETADDKDTGWSEFRLRRKLESHSALTETTDASVSASEQMVRAIGSRHTAYPTDLTIVELDKSSSLLQPRLLPYRRPGPVGGTVLLVDLLLERKSVFVLGEPGAGKTVLVYLTARDLLERGRVPLPVSIADLVGIEELGADALHNAVSRRVPWGERIDFSREDLVYIVDGIDEAVASGKTISELAATLERLPSLGTVLATCRTREFEDQLVGRVNLDSFNRIMVLDEWTSTDFHQFVSKLQAASLLDSDVVLDVVEQSEALARLVRRPLFARMLTFVLSNDNDDVTDLAGLYSVYLRDLARTVDSRLHLTGCEIGSSFSLWQEVAWNLYGSKLFHQELLPAAAPGSFLVAERGVSPHCANTVVHGLLDFVQVGGDLRARFRHYSFFEFLVAQYVATGLVERSMRGYVDCRDLLGLDLTREIRRHLTRILRHSAPEPVRALLLEQLANLDDTVSDESQRRVVGNLSAYILGRIGASPERLQRLLDMQQDGFLRTSLYWALANLDDVATTREYVKTLTLDSEMASLNRGYLLYYWGDFDRDRDPPYLDEVAGNDWSHTRQRTSDLMSADDYVERESRSRRVLDLYTFVDLAAFHGTTLSDGEIELVTSRFEDLGDYQDDIAPIVNRVLPESAP